MFSPKLEASPASSEWYMIFYEEFLRGKNTLGG